jgi:signal transduction histidine kinase
MQILRLPSIRAKLLALFAVAGLLPIALVSLLAYFNSLKAVEEMVGNRTERLSEEVAEQLSEKLERRVNDRILVVNRPVQDFLGGIGTGSSAAQMKAYSVLEGYLGDLFKEYADYYDGVILADAEGGLVFHYSRSEGAAGVLASPAAVWEVAPPAPVAPATPRAVVLGDSIRLSAELKRQARSGERLAKRIEVLGRQLESTWNKKELSRLHATQDSLLDVLHKTLRSDELSQELAIVFETLPALTRSEDEPPSAPWFDSSTPPPGLVRILPNKAVFTEADHRAVEEGADLEDGDYLLYTDRVAPGGVRSLRLVMPVYSTEAKDERLGTLVANVRLKHLFPEDLAAERFGSKGELAVIGSEDGEILFHTRAELVGRDIRQADSRLADLVDAHGGDDPVPEPWTRLSGGSGKRLASAERVSEVPWVVFATAVPREFEAEARKAGVINLTVALLAILFAFTVLLYSSGRISHSIQELTVGAREIQTGNLSHAIRVQTHDEIQTLGEAFNAMTASLRESIALREKAARELEALNRTLEDRVHERTRELRSLNSALETANQELKELDRLKSQFLATVSHEFRTPLTSIKAFSEILLDEVEPESESPQIRRFLGIINAESDRLGRLIKNLLNMSRLESGRMVWRMSVFPLRDVVEAAVDSLIPAFQEKNLEVIREHDCPEVRVRVDRDRIQEVVTNLLENAVKFSEHDGRIWVACVMEAPEGNGGPRVRVSVRDEGCGVPPGHLEKIFDRFSQVDASDTRARGGTGLGLAISKEIVDHHGGRIWAESVPGNGATFHFTLPVAEDGAREGPEDEESSHSLAPGWRASQGGGAA